MFQSWEHEFRSALVRYHLPRSYIDRLVYELRDHFESACENNSSDRCNIEQRAIHALGQPHDVARSAADVFLKRPVRRRIMMMLVGMPLISIVMTTMMALGIIAARGAMTQGPINSGVAQSLIAWIPPLWPAILSLTCIASAIMAYCYAISMRFVFWAIASQIFSVFVFRLRVDIPADAIAGERRLIVNAAFQPDTLPVTLIVGVIGIAAMLVLYSRRSSLPNAS